MSQPTFWCENQNDIIFPYYIVCACAVLWKIEQFISQEHANKSLVLDTWKIIIMEISLVLLLNKTGPRSAVGRAPDS